MKIREIIGEKDRIRFRLEGEAKADTIYTVEVQRPFGVKKIGTFHVKGKEQLLVERYFDKEDLLTAQFTVLGLEESGNSRLKKHYLNAGRIMKNCRLSRRY